MEITEYPSDRTPMSHGPMNTIDELLVNQGWKLIEGKLGFRKFHRYAREGDLYIEMHYYRTMSEHLPIKVSSEDVLSAKKAI